MTLLAEALERCERDEPGADAVLAQHPGGRAAGRAGRGAVEHTARAGARAAAPGPTLAARGCRRRKPPPAGTRVAATLGRGPPRGHHPAAASAELP